MNREALRDYVPWKMTYCFASWAAQVIREPLIPFYNVSPWHEGVLQQERIT